MAQQRTESLWKILTTKRMFVCLMLGFYGGLPLLLTSRTLQAWMTEAQVDLKTIGLFALVGNPYTLKFLWSPIFDRFVPFKFGRRKSWLIINQVGLIFCILGMAWTNPLQQIGQLALFALLTAFFSASLDVVIDAYRREILPDLEFGMGSSLYVGGYRGAMWLAQAPALLLSAYIPWSMIYTIAAGIVATGIFLSLWAHEPKVTMAHPKTLKEAVIDPLTDFFKLNGAWAILLFILCFKLGDAVAGNMLMPFYLREGSLYTKEEVAIFAKTYSFLSFMLGTFLGASILLKLGVVRSLMIFGVLQAVSTVGFAAIAVMERSIYLFGSVIFFEDFTGGLGTAAFMTYMGSMTNKRFTATQYALLTSLSAVPRSFLAAPAGALAEAVGWPAFFIIAGLAAIPGLLMIPFLSSERSSRESTSG